MAIKNGKEIKLIKKIIKPFGYSIVNGKNHDKIIDQNGNCLLGFATSPSDIHWYKNVINQLIKNGKLPGVDKL